ncbi:hypothetical protein ACHAWF_009996, partial [Thalassiosira exigua]
LSAQHESERNYLTSITWSTPSSEAAAVERRGDEYGAMASGLRRTAALARRLCGRGSTSRSVVASRRSPFSLADPRRRSFSSSRVPNAPLPPGSILTFLTPSVGSSDAAAEFLRDLFGFPRVAGVGGTTRRGEGGGGGTARDRLDELHFGSDPSSAWESVACRCPRSGTVLHFLSPSTDRSEGEAAAAASHSPIHLIGIHGSDSRPKSSPSSDESFHIAEDQCYRDALVECRERLAGGFQRRQIITTCDEKHGPSSASALEARLRGLLLRFACNVMGRRPHPSWIMDKYPSSSQCVTPLVDLAPLAFDDSRALTECNNDSKDTATHERLGSSGRMRELALPFVPGESSLQTKLSKSSLSRPLPGLYRCSRGETETDRSGLIFRPIPAAEEDLRLPPPSLVFQCDSLEESRKLVESQGGRTSKIGWRGDGGLGSLIVGHPSVPGLDIRVCEASGDEWALSARFDEAQESLLAASLTDLQSKHVVSEGQNQGVDSRSGNGNCWVELRANVRRPAGFFRRLAPTKVEVAKPPDVPYE